MKKGFTLIELLLVFALVTIITGLSAVFYSRFLIQNAVLNTVDQIVGQMHKAQTYAIAGKQNGNWGVNFSSQKLTLYLGNSYAARTSAYDETFTVSSNISVTGLSELNFTKITGTPSATPTITITGNNTTKSITVNSQGMIAR